MSYHDNLNKLLNDITLTLGQLDHNKTWEQAAVDLIRELQLLVLQNRSIEVRDSVRRSRTTWNDNS